MKRYRVLNSDFDTRATILNLTIEDSWDEPIKKQWSDIKAKILAGLRHEYGDWLFEKKEKNFRELGPAPFSIIAFHNVFLRQVRQSFIIGGYYPALTGACALGERILNQLILSLREDFRSSPEYKKVYNKKSFDDWDKVIDVLSSWDVFLPEASKSFRKFKETRNEVIHFKPEVDKNDRALALKAVHELSAIIEEQFGVRRQPWFIPGIDGIYFIKKDYETKPFVKRVYLPNCALVGPQHTVEHVNDEFVAKDPHRYEERAITDEEFAMLYRTAAKTQGAISGSAAVQVVGGGTPPSPGSDG